MKYAHAAFLGNEELKKFYHKLEAQDQRVGIRKAVVFSCSLL
jgi:hypothetical protein